MKKLTNHFKFLLLSICMLLMQGCDYAKLSIDELNAEVNKIDEELKNLKFKKEEIERVKADKEATNGKIEKAIDQYKKADRQALWNLTGELGNALYLALNNGYLNKGEEIMKVIASKAAYYTYYTWRVVGYALNQAVQDKNCDLHKMLQRLEQVKGTYEIADYIVWSWLVAGSLQQNNATIQDWKSALDKLRTSYPNKEYYDFQKVMETFVKRRDLDSNLKEFFNQVVNHDPIPSYLRGYNCLRSAIPNPFTRLTYKLSNPTHDKRGENEYSDSEEEDAPHHNGVYNFTKHGVFDIGDRAQEYYSPVKGENGHPISNYVTSYEAIDPKKLEQDAEAIKSACGNNSITILCVALRKYDGHIKKFVFTNTISDSKQHTDASRKVHELGYHVIMAQPAHAEAELMQFLQERPTRYTHIVAMGCSRNHCPLCGKMMNWIFNWNDSHGSYFVCSNCNTGNYFTTKLLDYSQNFLCSCCGCKQPMVCSFTPHYDYKKISASGTEKEMYVKDGKDYFTWYIPLALKYIFQSGGLQDEKTIKEQYGHYKTNQPDVSNNARDYLIYLNEDHKSFYKQLSSPEAWKNRCWRTPAPKKEEQDNGFSNLVAERIDSKEEVEDNNLKDITPSNSTEESKDGKEEIKRSEPKSEEKDKS